MRHVMSSLLRQITQTHTWANTQAQSGAHAHVNTTVLGTDIVPLCFREQQFKLHNTYAPLQQLVPPYVSKNISISAEQRTAVHRKKEDRFLEVQWVDERRSSRHPPSVCSSAPQDVTPFIILLHATQLRLAAFFSHNQLFIHILWWLRQTLEQTAAPHMALSGRRFRRLIPYPAWICQSKHVKLYLKRLCEVFWHHLE